MKFAMRRSGLNGSVDDVVLQFECGMFVSKHQTRPDFVDVHVRGLTAAHYVCT